MRRRELITLAGAAATSAALNLRPALARVAGPEISIRWLGAAMMELNIGGVRLLTDPCLGEGEHAFEMADPNEMFDLAKGPNIKTHRRLSRFPGMSYSDYDAVLLSHAHEDHFDQAARDWLGAQGPVLSPSHDVPYLKEKGVSAQAFAHGETRHFTRGNTRVRITATVAIHSQSPQISGMLGQGNGYWIDVENGGQVQSIYWAADTFMLDPVLASLPTGGAPDLFIPHIGAVGTKGAFGPLSMTGAQAVAFAARVGAKRILPVHHSTYALYLEPVSAIEKAHAETKSGARLNVIGEGASLAL